MRTLQKSRFYWAKALSLAHAALVGSLALSGCSLRPATQDLTFVIDTSALSASFANSGASTGQQKGHAVSESTSLSTESIPELPAPSQFFATSASPQSGFSCLAVNVTGSVIPSRPTPNGVVFHPQYSPKIFSSLIRIVRLKQNEPLTRISLPMPAAGEVHVAIWGIQSSAGGCPQVDGQDSGSSEKYEVYALAASSLNLQPGNSVIDLSPKSATMSSLTALANRVFVHQSHEPQFFFSLDSNFSATPSASFSLAANGSVPLYLHERNPGVVSISSVTYSLSDDAALSITSTNLPISHSGGQYVPGVVSFSAASQTGSQTLTTTVNYQVSGSSFTESFPVTLYYQAQNNVGGGSPSLTAATVLTLSKERQPGTTTYSLIGNWSVTAASAAWQELQLWKSDGTSCESATLTSSTYTLASNLTSYSGSISFTPDTTRCYCFKIKTVGTGGDSVTSNCSNEVVIDTVPPVLTITANQISAAPLTTENVMITVSASKSLTAIATASESITNASQSLSGEDVTVSEDQDARIIRFRPLVTPGNTSIITIPHSIFSDSEGNPASGETSFTFTRPAAKDFDLQVVGAPQYQGKNFAIWLASTLTLTPATVSLNADSPTYTISGGQWTLDSSSNCASLDSSTGTISFTGDSDCLSPFTVTLTNTELHRTDAGAPYPFFQSVITLSSAPIPSGNLCALEFYSGPSCHGDAKTWIGLPKPQNDPRPYLPVPAEFAAAWYEGQMPNDGSALITVRPSFAALQILQPRTWDRMVLEEQEGSPQFLQSVVHVQAALTLTASTALTAPTSSYSIGGTVFPKSLFVKNKSQLKVMPNTSATPAHPEMLTQGLVHVDQKGELWLYSGTTLTASKGAIATSTLSGNQRWGLRGFGTLQVGNPTATSEQTAWIQGNLPALLKIVGGNPSSTMTAKTTGNTWIQFQLPGHTITAETPPQLTVSERAYLTVFSGHTLTAPGNLAVNQANGGLKVLGSAYLLGAYQRGGSASYTTSVSNPGNSPNQPINCTYGSITRAYELGAGGGGFSNVSVSSHCSASQALEDINSYLSFCTASGGSWSGTTCTGPLQSENACPLPKTWQGDAFIGWCK
jgi:hypothetical protein